MHFSSDLTGPRNALAEAVDVVGDAYDPALLEPSPPAVTTGSFLADDPVSPPRRPGTRLVGPFPVGDLSWDEWLAEHPSHTTWVTERWLGGPRRLPAAPISLTATRISLHRLAAYVIAPARHSLNGKFGLRWTLGGFGTPFFGPDRQIRVAGRSLVDQIGVGARTTTITTLREAAEFLACDIDPTTAAEADSPTVGDIDEPLTLDPAGADFLGAWYGMAFAALEALRADPRCVEPSRPQLWPGHFDPAIEEGDEDHRASHGASPGDGHIPEPYLYTSFWSPDRIGLDRADRRWNAPGFFGSVLRLSTFPSGEDPVATAVRFWTANREAATGRL